MKNIIFAGVGGQGVLLATRVLMETALKAGYDVKESEIHGMAQRGGSVDCHIRYGEKVYSPLIPRGKTDFLVSLELLEAVRRLDYIGPEGMMIVNNLVIEPTTVTTGTATYPEDIAGWLKDNLPKSEVYNTEAILKELGSKKALNIVMLGILSRYLEFTEAQWEDSIRAVVKEKFVDLNLRAFHFGRGL